MGSAAPVGGALRQRLRVLWELSGGRVLRRQALGEEDEGGGRGGGADEVT